MQTRSLPDACIFRSERMMKKSRAETSGALSGEFADRVRPPYASDEKRRQAAELFEHGIGYQRASPQTPGVLDL